MIVHIVDRKMPGACRLIDDIVSRAGEPGPMDFPVPGLGNELSGEFKNIDNIAHLTDPMNTNIKDFNVNKDSCDFMFIDEPGAAEVILKYMGNLMFSSSRYSTNSEASVNSEKIRTDSFELDNGTRSIPGWEDQFIEEEPSWVAVERLKYLLKYFYMLSKDPKLNTNMLDVLYVKYETKVRDKGLIRGRSYIRNSYGGYRTDERKEPLGIAMSFIKEDKGYEYKPVIYMNLLMELLKRFNIEVDKDIDIEPIAKLRTCYIPPNSLYYLSGDRDEVHLGGVKSEVLGKDNYVTNEFLIEYAAQVAKYEGVKLEKHIKLGASERNATVEELCDTVVELTRDRLVELYGEKANGLKLYFDSNGFLCAYPLGIVLFAVNSGKDPYFIKTLPMLGNRTPKKLPNGDYDIGDRFQVFSNMGAFILLTRNTNKDITKVIELAFPHEHYNSSEAGVLETVINSSEED